MKKTFIILALFLSGWFMSCNESFLEWDAVGSFSESLLATPEGVSKALTSAYSYLNAGGYDNNLFCEFTGSIAGGEYNKGSSAFDVSRWLETVGWYHSSGSVTAQRNFALAYTGIDRCNIVIQLCSQAEGLSEVQKNQFIAEARFLRGMWYMHLKKNFYNVPWIDETTTDARVQNFEGDPGAANYVDVWPNIFSDFEFAKNNLAETHADLARPNSWAAQCMLAKAYVYAGTYDVSNYQGQFSQALTLLNDAISNGVTTAGNPYTLLENYHDNFDAAYEHHSEYVWGIELTTLDGDPSGSRESPNAWPGSQNWGLWADPNGPDGALGWGFMQPTEWYANHFRVDARGLPYLDMFVGTSSSSDTLADDYGLAPAPASFEADTQGLDPRLDWSVGRRGIDYLGWGDFPGSSWIRAQLDHGPYENKKFHVWKDQVGVYVSTANCYPAINMPVMRFAEVLLLAAECEARTDGNLSRARDLVNQVRARMAENAASGRHWVKVGGRDGTVDAANYRIGLYDAANPDDPFATTDGALDAILYERLLELGGEGHRFYDVVRFGKGLEELNTYMNFTKSLKGPNGNVRYGHYTASFSYEEPKDKFMPIPTTAIDRSKKEGIPTLIQNPGY